MTCIDPEKRMTIEDIRESKWFNGPIYDQNELKIVVHKELKLKSTIKTKLASSIKSL